MLTADQPGTPTYLGSICLDFLPNGIIRDFSILFQSTMDRSDDLVRARYVKQAVHLAPTNRATRHQDYRDASVS